MEISAAASLEDLEAIISRGISAFIETGNALREIRERQLYEGFATFEDYCLKRWGWHRRYGDRLIDAAIVAENLSPIGLKPRTETQARELARLSPDRQREVAATINFKEATQAQIRDRVQQELQTMKSKPSEAATPKVDGEDLENRLVQAAALPQPIPEKQLYECLGTIANIKHSREQWSRALKLVPWLKLRTYVNGDVRVIIDDDLREICHRRRKGGQLPMEFCRDLYAQFSRRRKEANLARQNRSWNTDAICKVDLINVLTWVESELLNYINGRSTLGREKATKPPQQGKGTDNDHEAKSRNDPVDAGVGPTVQ